MNQLLWDTYRKNASAFVYEWAHERDEKGGRSANDENRLSENLAQRSYSAYF